MQSLTTPLVRVFHAGFNKIGMEEKLRAGDTWIAENIQFTGATPWHLRFASRLGAVVEFNSCIIQNAGGEADDCEIDEDVIISGGLIDQCGKLAIKGGLIEDLTVSNYASTAGVAITEDSTVQDVVFRSGNQPTKYAIEIPDPEAQSPTESPSILNFTLDGVFYEQHDFDIRVLGDNGTVNISILGGGDIPFISAGVETTETPALLGSPGWQNGTSYTAEVGGSPADSLRAVFVAVTNNDSKLPDTVTFGGVDMTLLNSNLSLLGSPESSIGVSLYMLIETGNASVFTGSQTVAATWTGGTPSQVTFQFATYDHIRQLGFTPNVASDSLTQAGGGSLAVLDDWVQAYETNNATVTVSSGSNRLLVVTEGNENNGGLAGSSGCTWGGEAMTLEISAYGGGGPDNGTQIWTLDEAGIAAAIGDTLTFTGFAGDTPSYGAIVMSGVDQTTPVRDRTSDTGQDPNTSDLSINNGDILISSFSTSPGASALTSWDNELSTPDSTFSIPPAPGVGDDPFDCARKDYGGSNTTTGQVGATGGDSVRTGFCCISIAPGGVNAGPLFTNVPTQDRALVLSVAHTEAPTPFGITFTGDVTERAQVALTASPEDNRISAVADFVDLNSPPVTADANISDSSTENGAIAQMITVSIPPARTTSGGPTVNVTANVTVRMTNIIPGTEIRVYPVESPANLTEIAGIESVGSPNEFSFVAQAGLLVRIVVFHLDFVLPPANELILEIPISDTSFPISQVIDRNYFNPT
jgi:hypothetical protein